MEVGEPAQGLDILADRVGPDHDLDAVVAESRGDLEGRRRRLRIDGRRGQRYLRIGNAHGFLAHPSHLRTPGAVLPPGPAPRPPVRRPSPSAREPSHSRP